MQRKKIYGSLASRTLGDVYRDSDAAKSGLEWCYDTLLRGKNGYEHRTKVRNNRVSFVDQEPVHGHDLVSTIDVRIQDIAEKALADQMNEGTLATQAEKGIAIVMEVKTGDIKAMVSLTRVGSGPEDLVEIQNDAINALWEPGSTFKTGSMMVAMEDGYVTPETVVFCHNGVWPIYGRKMKDHNWATKGGYQDLTVTEILGQSSNIGVSKIIDKYYHDCPERFVKGLYKLGVGIDYGLPMGANPRVRMPQREGKHYSNWSNTTLPCMSIGYETQHSPLNTLTFYNAIANGGRMVRPRFVRAEMEGDKLIREFPVEVIKEKICSERTLRWTQEMLEKVVSEGLGGRAGNPRFRVSGKTGTAQVAVNGSYAVRRYLVSFCGYFPADEPQYSCIVAIYKHGLPASGGGQAGPVFSRISQRVMNTGEGRPLGEATDSTTVVYPMMGNGRTDELRDLLNMMQLPWTDYASDARWASIEHDSLTQRITLRAATGSEGQVPNVVGMGARDAVYALREAGLKVRLSGKGRVRQQSIAPGTAAQGQTISITLN